METFAVDGSALEKPFRSIDEQIEILNNRGLPTDDRTEFTLMREGYHSVVNGYKDLFLDAAATQKAKEDAYVHGTHFIDIFNLFTFDRELRSTLMKYFASAEATLKATCAHAFTKAHQDERNPYLNILNYKEKYQKKGKALDLIDEFKTAVGLNDGDGSWRRKSYLRHYVDNHGGEVPLWVLMNYATLGQAFRFYCFIPEGIRNEVAKSYSKLYEDSYGEPKRIHPRMLRTAYDHVKDFRNICAHDERLYCAKVSPSNDTPVGRVVDDLQLLIPKGQHEQLNRQTQRLAVTPATLRLPFQSRSYRHKTTFRVEISSPVIYFCHGDHR